MIKDSDVTAEAIRRFPWCFPPESDKQQARHKLKRDWRPTRDKAKAQARSILQSLGENRAATVRAMPNVSHQEVRDFSDHCVFIRSVYLFMERIFRFSDASERETMDAIAPLFFEDLGKVFVEFITVAACKITDPAKDPRGNENVTVEMFVNNSASEPETFAKLNELHQRMHTFRAKLLPARNKLGSHIDRATALSGKPLGAASFEEWRDFWSTLRDFVRILNEKTIGTPFEIDAGCVFGDAEMLLKAFRQSQHFEALLKANDPAVKDACFKVALPNA